MPCRDLCQQRSKLCRRQKALRRWLPSRVPIAAPMNQTCYPHSPWKGKARDQPADLPRLPQSFEAEHTVGFSSMHGVAFPGLTSTDVGMLPHSLASLSLPAESMQSAGPTPAVASPLTPPRPAFMREQDGRASTEASSSSCPRSSPYSSRRNSGSSAHMLVFDSRHGSPAASESGWHGLHSPRFAEMLLASTKGSTLGRDDIRYEERLR